MKPYEGKGKLLLGSLLIIVTLVACGSSESAIVGTWINEDGKEYTFFKDGTLGYKSGSSSSSGTYSIEDSTMRMSMDGQSILCEFKINGKEMTWSLSNGNSFVLTKKLAGDAALNGETNPTAAVRALYAAVEKGDAKAMEKVTTPKMAALLASKDGNGKTLMEFLKVDIATNGKIIDTSEKIDGDTATVKLTFANGTTDSAYLIKDGDKWKVDAK